MKRFRAWVDKEGIKALTTHQLFLFLESDPQFKCTGSITETLIGDAIQQVNKMHGVEDSSMLDMLSTDHVALFLKAFHEKAVEVMLPSNITELEGLFPLPK